MENMELFNKLSQYIGKKIRVTVSNFNKEQMFEFILVGVDITDGNIWANMNLKQGFLITEKTVWEPVEEEIIGKIIPEHTYRQSFISANIEDESCPLQAYYNFIEVVDVPKPFQLFIGSVFHKVYETFFNEKIARQKLEDENSNLSLTDVMSYARQQFDIIKKNDYPNIKLDDVGDKITHTNSTLLSLVMQLVNTYYPIAVDINDAEATEVYAELYIEELKTLVTTHLDLLRTDKITDYKSARVYRYSNKGPKSGGEYFPDWDMGKIKKKAQPRLHKLLFRNMPYNFHVIGKGETSLFKSLPVVDTDEGLAAWKDKILIPVIKQMNQGNFVARPNNFCTVCPYFKDKKRCGIGL